MTARETMSSFKLGLSILWPASWTALPIKMAFAVLFMAMGSIQVETTLGVTFLMLLMTPVSVFAFFIISLGVGFHFGEGIGLHSFRNRHRLCDHRRGLSSTPMGH